MGNRGGVSRADVQPFPDVVELVNGILDGVAEVPHDFSPHDQDFVIELNDPPKNESSRT